MRHASLCLPNNAVSAARHVALPLLVGALTYLLPRRQGMFGPASRPVCWLLDHLADGAWAYATGAFVTLVWTVGARRTRIAWTLVALALVLGVELAQRWHLVAGTYDPVDLAVMSLAFVAAVTITSIKEKEGPA
jgi:hypothetical protein